MQTFEAALNLSYGTIKKGKRLQIVVEISYERLGRLQVCTLLIQNLAKLNVEYDFMRVTIYYYIFGYLIKYVQILNFQ